MEETWASGPVELSSDPSSSLSCWEELELSPLFVWNTIPLVGIQGWATGV